MNVKFIYKKKLIRHMTKHSCFYKVYFVILCALKNKEMSFIKYYTLKESLLFLCLFASVISVNANITT